MAGGAVGLVFGAWTGNDKDTGGRPRAWGAVARPPFLSRTCSCPGLLFFVGRARQPDGLGALLVRGDPDGGEHLSLRLLLAGGERVEKEVFVALHQGVFQYLLGFGAIGGIDLKQAADQSGQALAEYAWKGVEGAPYHDSAEVLNTAGSRIKSEISVDPPQKLTCARKKALPLRLLLHENTKFSKSTIRAEGLPHEYRNHPSILPIHPP